MERNRHIAVARLVAFMLGREMLDQVDGEHLSHCQFCFTRMVDATGEQLQEESAEWKEKRSA